MTETVKTRKAVKYAVSKRALTEETRIFFMQNFGCVRKVYNLYVDWLFRRLEEIGYQVGERIPKMKLPEVSEFKKESMRFSETRILWDWPMLKSLLNRHCDISMNHAIIRRIRTGLFEETNLASKRFLFGGSKGCRNSTPRHTAIFLIRQTANILRKPEI